MLRLGTTEDDWTIADLVARYSTEVLAPAAAELDATESSCTRHLPGLAELGVMGMNLPETLGGPGLSHAAMLLSLIEISKACAATSSMIGAHYLGTDAILIGGNADQHEHWLPRAASGEWLGSFALTEPGGGSHPADLRTIAQHDGDQYRLTGVKHFISNAAEAKFIVVFAKTDPTAGARGVSAFVVDRESPGVTVSQPEALMGIRSAHAFEVSFDGAVVPAANRLGDEGSGFRTAMKVLDNSRLDVAATAIGIAEAALQAATAWVQQRTIAGEPLASKQGVQFMLADMRLQLEASWALTMQAVALRSAGLPFTPQSAMAKLHATEMVAFVTDTALQLHGGYGYSRQLPLERYVRDARILRIYEGASEIQRVVIARSVLAG